MYVASGMTYNIVISISIVETKTKFSVAHRTIMKSTHDSIAQVQTIIAAYAEHASSVFVYGGDVKMYMKAFQASHVAPIPLAVLVAEIQRFHRFIHEIDTLSFDVMTFPMVCVSTVRIKSILKERGLAIRNALIDSIVTDAREKNLEISRRYQHMLHQITEKPTNEAELATLKSFVQASKATIAGMVGEVHEIHARLESLSAFAHNITHEDFALAWSTKEWPKRIAYAADTCDSALEEDKIRMMDKLALEKEQFEVDLERYEKEVALFKTYGEIERTVWFPPSITHA